MHRDHNIAKLEGIIYQTLQIDVFKTLKQNKKRLIWHDKSYAIVWFLQLRKRYRLQDTCLRNACK